MFLKKISLVNFKNYDEAELTFTAGANAFAGDNGAGKTNLLDAVHYLSMCKSYFNPIDSQQIKQDRDLFMLQGVFEKNQKEEMIACGVKKNQKKQFKRNKKEYTRLAEHIGLFPLVMISPNDISLILEGSEERRKFIDTVISLTNPRYLEDLIAYNKTLQNRNALLKQIADSGRYDPALLEVFDDQLINYGTTIFEQRKTFMEIFTPVFDRHYQYLCSDAETVKLIYESPLFDDDFSKILKKNLEKDRILQRTSQGIHKDELVFQVHAEMPLKKFGSQGQQKSFLIALKLAKYSFIYQKVGFKPMLLLDDIFDKLDDLRITKLMKMVSHEDFGQIFITDTNAKRIKRIFEDIGVNLNLFHIEKSIVTHEQN
ncbi:DNA replication and repair protein RecF [Pedobacter sp. SD-b]|uniref:DNA replication and repair protein RecF n=1 Tax=Pedobacter segetis TaxID=2793069 RepID=A0ABS1BI45_9SPHI|nr:DNA replication and repair protein RecF [Pedobacter segetis]MBK0382031.1 DNA replication and repair protein RecF [Pedobacter segetis]